MLAEENIAVGDGGWVSNWYGEEEERRRKLKVQSAVYWRTLEGRFQTFTVGLFVGLWKKESKTSLLPNLAISGFYLCLFFLAGEQ